MAGDRNKRSSSALLIGAGIAATLMVVAFIGSFSSLGQMEPERALWLLGTGFVLAICTGILVGLAVARPDRSLNLGAHVSPYGAARYSPGPDTPLPLGNPVSGAHSDDGGD